MPVKNRHSYKVIESVAAGAQSEPIDMEHAQTAIIYLKAAGATTIQMQATFDDPSQTTPEWFDVIDTLGNPLALVLTGSGTFAYQIGAPIPGRIRFNNTGLEALNRAAVEGVRGVD